MNKTQTTAGIGCYHLLPFRNDITGNLHESSYKGDCDAKHRLRRGKMSKITNLPIHAHQMSTSPSLPPDLEILDSATSNHPPPSFQNWTSHGEREFFWDFRLGCLKSRPPPPNPTPNFEHFFTSDLVTSNHPLPPNLEHFLNFRFGYFKSPSYTIFWTLDSVISNHPLPTLSPIYTIFLNFRFGYLKSPPQMELLIENLNIVETSLYTERLPSR